MKIPHKDTESTGEKVSVVCKNPEGSSYRASNYCNDNSSHSNNYWSEAEWHARGRHDNKS